MEKELEKEILRKAVVYYGKTSQIQVAIEEMSELTKELCKDLRGEPDLEHIVEEMADVQIMLDQLRIIYDWKGWALWDARDYKLNILQRRMAPDSLENNLDTLKRNLEALEQLENSGNTPGEAAQTEPVQTEDVSGESGDTKHAGS